MNEQQLPIERVPSEILNVTEPVENNIASGKQKETSITNPFAQKEGIIHLPTVLIASGERDYQHPDLQSLAYRKSPVRLDQQPVTKGAKKAMAILTQAQSISIISDQVRLNPATLTHTIDGNSFCEIQSQSGNLWFVLPRVLVPKQADGKSRSEIQLGSRTINPLRQDVISGICLFGVSAVTAEADDGTMVYLANSNGSFKNISTKFTKLHVNRSVHPYEMETVLRLTSFLEAAMSHKDLRITFHIPRLEYWLYALPLYEQGLIDKDLLQQWFSEVDQRARKMQNFLTKVAPNNATVAFVSPLSTIEGILSKGITRGEKNFTQRLLDQLATDSYWQELFETSDSIAKKQQETRGKGLQFKSLAEYSTNDINYLSYVTAYAQTLDKSDDGLLLAVENPEEVRILEQGTQLIRSKDDQKAILALYVHPNFFVSEGNAIAGRHELFFFTDEKSSVKAPQLVKKIYATSPKLPKAATVFERI